MKLTVQLESLAFGGEAVGRADDGRVVLCRRGAPGDVVEARITERHARWLRAEVASVLDVGPSRVEPRCPHFAECGACQWQHVSYAAQLGAKHAIVAAALRKQGVVVEGPVPAKSEYGTRRRVRMRVDGGRIGYSGWRSHAFVPVDACPVLEPRLWRAVRDFASRGAVLKGELVALAGASGESVAGVVGARAGSEAGAPVDLAAPGEPSLLVPPIVFAQASAEGDRALCSYVRELADVCGRSVLELFAGAGNFTRWLLHDGGRVAAVEGDAFAFAWLAQNASAARRIAGEVGRAVRRLAGEGERFDVVVLDPPRAGCRALLGDLARLAPERIVYVSCDPMTLARDLEGLASLGYRTTRARAFDLMPQTSQVETVALLTHG